MRDFNDVVAHLGARAVLGRLAALEGGRGVMRVTLREPLADLAPGTECVLEMHDGARFRVSVMEDLDGHGHEFRLKLLGRA